MSNRLASALSLALLALPAVAQNQAWIRQFGSNVDDWLSVAMPDGGGGVFVSGYTDGAIGGPLAGGSDIWVAQFDRAGNRNWIRQFGTNNYDFVLSGVPDGATGMYLAGYTYGNFITPGQPNAGNTDAWLARFDAGGNQLWLLQFGTSGDESIASASPDGSGGVYVGGLTHGALVAPSNGQIDGWLAHYDSAGNRTWGLQIGTSTYDWLSATAPDGLGGVYVGGGTYGSFSGSSTSTRKAWIARYDIAGTQLWIRESGTSSLDDLWAAAPDAVGGVFVGGPTGPTGAGAWLGHYDSAGNQTWYHQLAANVRCAAPDGLGGVHFVGSTSVNTGGTNAGLVDAWIARYDLAGNQVWIRQLGTSSTDVAWPATSDGAYGLYCGGYTSGDLGGPNAGGSDAWLAYYDLQSSYCTAGTTTHGCTAQIAANSDPSVAHAYACNITVTNVEGLKAGILFYGINNSGFAPGPWGSGSTSWLCVKHPTQRTPVQNSGGTINLCNGSFVLDWNAYQTANPFALGNPWSVGDKVYAQAWFRDPPAAKSTNLSNAVEMTYGP